jgi:hypothetical protein
MIPHGIKSTGPYAELWSQLKSMSHSLNRAAAAKDISEVAELDKGRLVALAAFLKQELEPFDAAGALSNAGFLTFEASDLSYSFEEDVRTLLEDLASFTDWLKQEGIDANEKTAKLIASVREFSRSLSSGNLPTPRPSLELQIVKELLAKLVLRTESALAA